jgi:hypothetical protein
MKTLSTTFTAHYGSDRDRLVDRLVGCKDWSHIGQVTASPQLCCVDCTAYFSRDTKRARKACFGAQVLNNWRLKSFQ